MAIITGDRSSYASDINVTPMIDVLLVLLIIFMLIVPITPNGLNVVVPHPSRTADPATLGHMVVVQAYYHSGGPLSYTINGIDVAKSDLLSDLRDLFATRAERVLFVSADDKVDFAAVTELIAIGRAARVDHIGLITPKVQLSQ